MVIIKHISLIEELLASPNYPALSRGFVPTMGALHAGHLSLIEKSKSENQHTIASIFINPTQFNHAADFEKYPVTVERDIEMLEASGCDLLFLPTIKEMYPDSELLKKYDLGYLETILEGKYRPGHFEGVCQIVDKLLAIVKPSALYLGQKDYQQCLVITKLIEITGYPVALHTCPTLREPDGLAMSSRNTRLNKTERQQAVTIIHCLQKIKALIKPGDTHGIIFDSIAALQQAGFTVDYVSIANAETLEAVNEWDGEEKIVGLVAAYLNEIRLIDNLPIN